MFPKQHRCHRKARTLPDNRRHLHCRPAHPYKYCRTRHSSARRSGCCGSSSPPPRPDTTPAPQGSHNYRQCTLAPQRRPYRKPRSCCCWSSGPRTARCNPQALQHSYKCPPHSRAPQRRHCRRRHNCSRPCSRPRSFDCSSSRQRRTPLGKLPASTPSLDHTPCRKPRNGRDVSASQRSPTRSSSVPRDMCTSHPYIADCSDRPAHTLRS